ncbi:hypothetical protein [Caenimonas sp. SL110]|uniref:hypothetical protein n=1 Tax=Caenimonas sp. SL110 TaxID=1450524 RepID=UPI000653BC57|nr:hypothetical protein [Caenimonas sp. SL110]
MRNILKAAIASDGPANFEEAMRVAAELGDAPGNLKVSYRLIAQSLVHLHGEAQEQTSLESFFKALAPDARFGITFELQEILSTDAVPDQLRLQGLSVLEIARASLAPLYREHEKKLIDSAMGLRSALLGLPADLARDASRIAPAVCDRAQGVRDAVQRLKTLRTALELTDRDIETLTRQLTGLVKALNSCPRAVYDAMTDSQLSDMRLFLTEFKADPRSIDDVIQERKQEVLASGMVDALLAENLTAALETFAQARAAQQAPLGRSRDFLPAFFSARLQHTITRLNPGDRKHLATVLRTPQARELKGALALLQRMPVITEQPVLLGSLIALQDDLLAAGRAAGPVAPGAPPESPLASLADASVQLRQALGACGVGIDPQGVCFVKSGQVHRAIQQDVAANLDKTIAGQGLLETAAPAEVPATPVQQAPQSGKGPTAAATPQRKPAAPPREKPSPLKIDPTDPFARKGGQALRDLDKAWELEPRPTTPKAPLTPEVKAAPTRTMKEIEAERASKLPGQIAKSLVNLAAPLPRAGATQSSLKSMRLISNWDRPSKDEKSRMVAYVQAGLGDLTGPQLAQLRANLDLLTPAERSDSLAALVIEKVKNFPTPTIGVVEQRDYALAHALSGRRFDGALLLQALASLPLQELVAFRAAAITRNLPKVAVAADTTAWPESDWWAEPGAADRNPAAFVSSVTALVPIFSESDGARSASKNAQQLALRLKAAIQSTQFTGQAYNSEQLLQLRSALGRLGVRTTDPVSISFTALINKRLITSPGPRVQSRPVTPVAATQGSSRTRRQLREDDEPPPPPPLSDEPPPRMESLVPDEELPPPPPLEVDEPSPVVSQTPSLTGASRSTAEASTPSTPLTRSSRLTVASGSSVVSDSEASGYRASGSSTPTRSTSTSVSSSTPTPVSGSSTPIVKPRSGSAVRNWLRNPFSPRKASPPLLTLGEALKTFAQVVVSPAGQVVDHSAAWGAILRMQEGSAKTPGMDAAGEPQALVATQLAAMSDRELLGLWTFFSRPLNSKPEEIDWNFLRPLVGVIKQSAADRLGVNMGWNGSPLTLELAALLMTAGEFEPTPAGSGYAQWMRAANDVLRSTSANASTQPSEQDKRALTVDAMAIRLSTGAVSKEQLVSMLERASSSELLAIRNSGPTGQVPPASHADVVALAKSAAQRKGQTLAAQFMSRPLRAEDDLETFAKQAIAAIDAMRECHAHCAAHGIDAGNEFNTAVAGVVRQLNAIVSQPDLSTDELDDAQLASFAAAVHYTLDDSPTLGQAVSARKTMLANDYVLQMEAAAEALQAHDFARAQQSLAAAWSRVPEIATAWGVFDKADEQSGPTSVESTRAQLMNFAIAAIGNSDPNRLNAVSSVLDALELPQTTVDLNRIDLSALSTNAAAQVEAARSFVNQLMLVQQAVRGFLGAGDPALDRHASLVARVDVRAALREAVGIDFGEGSIRLVSGVAEQPVQNAVEDMFKAQVAQLASERSPKKIRVFSSSGKPGFLARARGGNPKEQRFELPLELYDSMRDSRITYGVQDGDREPLLPHTGEAASRLFDLTRNEGNSQEGSPAQMRTLTALGLARSHEAFDRAAAMHVSLPGSRPGSVDGDMKLAIEWRGGQEPGEVVVSYVYTVSDPKNFTVPDNNGQQVPLAAGGYVRSTLEMSVSQTGKHRVSAPLRTEFELRPSEEFTAATADNAQQAYLAAVASGEAETAALDEAGLLVRPGQFVRSLVEAIASFERYEMHCRAIGRTVNKQPYERLIGKLELAVRLHLQVGALSPEESDQLVVQLRTLGMQHLAETVESEAQAELAGHMILSILGNDFDQALDYAGRVKFRTTGNARNDQLLRSRLFMAAIGDADQKKLRSAIETPEMRLLIAAMTDISGIAVAAGSQPPPYLARLRSQLDVLREMRTYLKTLAPTEVGSPEASSQSLHSPLQRAAQNQKIREALRLSCSIELRSDGSVTALQ